MLSGGEISQSRETQNPVNRQSPGAQLVMEKCPKTGDVFRGFTRGKRKKIWDLKANTPSQGGVRGTSWCLVIGHSQSQSPLIVK